MWALCPDIPGHNTQVNILLRSRNVRNKTGGMAEMLNMSEQMILYSNETIYNLLCIGAIMT